MAGRCCLAHWANTSPSPTPVLTPTDPSPRPLPTSHSLIYCMTPGMVHVLEGHQGLTGEHAASVYTLTTTPVTADDSPPVMYALEVDSVTAPRTLTGSFVRVTVGAHRRRGLAGAAGVAGAACGGSNSSAGMSGDCGATGRGQPVPVAGIEVIAAPGPGRGSAATRGAATTGSSSSSSIMQRQSPPPPSNTSSTNHDVAFASSATGGTTSVPVLFILTTNCGNQVAVSGAALLWKGCFWCWCWCW